jgi:hypothetical protein
VDKRVLLRHTGTYTFDFQAQQPLYTALHEMAQTGQMPQTQPPAPPPEPPAPVVPTVLSTNTDKKPATKAKAAKRK